MYSQLSNSQQAVLDNATCPHCHSQNTVRKVWTRNGPTVKCDNCGKKVYRPRGRAVSQGGELTGGSAGGIDKGTVTGSGGEGEEEGEQEGEGEGSPSQNPSQPSQASQQASQNIGKPLSQAAQDAISKIEQALRQEMQKDMAKALAKMEQEKQDAKAELEEQVSEQVESLRPKELTVKHVDAKNEQIQTVQVAQPHKDLEEVLWRINAGINNFLFVGPSGSGKTTLAKQVAQALSVPYGMLPWSGDTTPGTVLGRPSPDGSSFNLSAWMQLYTQPAVWNHDELDGADPNVPICMNSAIENGEVFLPIGTLVRHHRHIVLATANTWGVGADMLYCGRNQLDAAVRDRFVGGCMFVDYDDRLETQLVPEDAFRKPFWDIRAKVFEHKLRRIWGTRTLIRGAKLWRHGKSLKETFAALTVGFSTDEKQKIGAA